MAFVISSQTVKGGPGKSTTAINLSAALAQLGYRTLLADCDYQGTCSRHYLGDGGWDNGMHDVFAATPLPATQLVQPTDYPNLSVIPSDDRLRHFDTSSGYEDSPSVLFLRQTIEELGDEFDFVVTDSPPRDHLSGYSTLVAADLLLALLVCERFAIESLRSFERQIDDVRMRRNPDIETRILINVFNKKSATHRDNKAVIQDHYGDRIMTAEIPDSESIKSAQMHGIPITVYRPKSNPAVATHLLAGEVVAMAVNQPKEKIHAQDAA